MGKRVMAVALLAGLLAFPMQKDQDGYYRGASGARYQYDLSRPADSLRYSVDPAAQL